jgi:limonene-1,2-epoxide hydrolase
VSNINKVLEFIAKWEAQDVEGIISSFSDSPFYHNVPMEPLTSKESIREFIVPLLQPATNVEWQVLFIAEDKNGVVLTERVDIFEFGDKRVSLPLMGTFEFEGDKLLRWRDYFDLRDLETQMAALQE